MSSSIEPRLSQARKQGRDVEITEVDKSGKVQRRWLHTQKSLTPMLSGTPSNSFSRAVRNWRKPLLDAFLPIGFPQSVTPDYLRYQTYDSLQAFFSTITSLLASRAILQGLGVGDASTSATYALLLTVLKDATSRVATIFFAYRVGLWIEPEAKFFRLAADVLNDSAFLMELMTPLLGDVGKVVVLSCAEASRALCGVAAGASKAALSQHFARHDNLAELNAKEASQETAVGLMGLLVGSVVVRVVQDPGNVLSLMVVLVLAHLYMNYLAVRAVCMKTLNRQRARILFDGFIREGKVLAPEDVAARESIMLCRSVARDAGGQVVASLDFADSYASVADAGSAGEDVDIQDDADSSLVISSRTGKLASIQIILWDGASSREVIRAWFLALAHAYDMPDANSSTLSVDTSSGGHRITADLGVKSKASRLWIGDAGFWDQVVGKGWNLDNQALEIAAPVRMRMAEWKKDE